MFETLTPFGWFLFILLLIWSFIWKGIALWRCAKKNHSTWFVIILIINTLGILEIIYLMIHHREIKKEIDSKNNKNKKTTSVRSRRRRKR
ncbi:MAG: DUF5652 family protein [archaeon]